MRRARSGDSGILRPLSKLLCARFEQEVAKWLMSSFVKVSGVLDTAALA